MLTPVSQKLNAVKKKHFDKCVGLFYIPSVLLFIRILRGKPKSMPGLFPFKEPSSQDDDDLSDDGEAVPTQDTTGDNAASDTKMVVEDDENPF